jgi:Flp pilus assembly protein TadG
MTLQFPKASANIRGYGPLRKGVAAVELLVMAPMLVLVCLVSVDCGRFAYSYLAVCNAVRVAAQCAATESYTTNTYSSWQSQVQSTAQAEMSLVPGFDASQWTLSVVPTSDSYSLFRVTVTGQYNFTPLLYWPGGSTSVPLGRQISMRQFR